MFPHIIISYLQSTQKVYNYSNSQIEGLRAAGATPQLLNYLQETMGFYAVASDKQKARAHRHATACAHHGGGYQSQQPFSTPLIDEWTDPAYEESLYSPFSFD